MTTRRLLTGPERPGTNVDLISTVTQYECDGCGTITENPQKISRVQGEIFSGGLNNVIYGDYCHVCIATKPIANLIK